ncbi:MAG TPA: type II toxin-antitoxin system VapC family toxin [Terriglobales bacterium]|jgi:predicted nucleic acid-binding protein|nr:type II toxin-antitoxin system VapC family toxin [Terriglobales bacterium]
MIILDTNVLSALMRQEPDMKVVAWLDRQPRTSIWTTSLTVLEVRFGLEIMATGKRRSLLMHAFESLLDKMGQRIASFDAAAARQAADLMASRQRKGRPGELRDTIIAGIALAHQASLATRNVSHFEDLSVSVVNPWDA